MRLVTQHPMADNAWSTKEDRQEDGDSPAPPELEARCLEKVVVRPLAGTSRGSMA